MTSKILFATILLIAFVLRFWQLGQSPSLYWDEPAIGYNAYSILTTGRDEYGNVFPFTFRSFDDYKAPGYIYLTVPSVAIFGLTEFAVRFPSALLGVLTVALVYFLVGELLKLGRSQQSSSQRFAVCCQLLSMASLAISPWHIHVSRIGFEANAAVFFLTLGIFLFVKFIDESKSQAPRSPSADGRSRATSTFLLIAFPLPLIASLYTYHSSRLLIPLLLTVYLIFFWKKFNKQLLVKLALVVLVLLIPLALVMLRPETQNRVIWSSLFSYQRPPEEINRLAQIDQAQRQDLSFGLLHSEPEYFTKGFLSRMTNHLSPIFLFLKGDDNQRLGFGTVGIYYLFELPFFILGVVFLTKHKTTAVILLPWFLLGILPAALTRDQTNLLRSLNAYVAGNIIIGLGAASFYQYLTAGKVLVRSVIFIPMAGLILWNVGFFLDNYFVHYANRTAPYWQYGYKQVVSKVSALQDKYDKIYVSTDYGQPYIYFLFYQKYPPAKYQPQARLVKDPHSVDVGEGAGYDKFEFRKLYWPADRGLRKSLFVGSPEQLPEKDIDPKEARIIDRVYFPNGPEAFRIVETL